jgi:hypothetical protein
LNEQERRGHVRQFRFNEDADVSTGGGAISNIPLGLPYLFFAPFLAVGILRQMITLPEMIVWWASFR